MTCAVEMLRRLCTAEASFERILDLTKFGMAIATMIRITATTTRSSMRENPLVSRLPSFEWFDLSWRRMFSASQLHRSCDPYEFCTGRKKGEEGFSFLPCWVSLKLC